MGFKFNPITSSLDLVGSSSSVAGSNKQIQFNDGGVLGADSNLTWDKTSDSLNVQTTFNTHPLHVNAATGTTINNVVTGSVSLVDETLPTSPTGSITQIAEFTAPSGTSPSQNTSGSGYSASGQQIDYQIYPVIYSATSGQYYISEFYESTGFTDTLNDASNFSIVLSLPTEASNQTHWLILKQIDGNGYNDSVLHAVGSNYEDTAFSGTASYTTWPTQYQLNYTVPVAPSGTVSSQVNVGFGNIFESGATYVAHIRGATNIGGTYFCEQTGDTSDMGFTDDNTGDIFDIDIIYTPNGSDEHVARVSMDGGSSWTYHFIGNSGNYTFNNPGNDSTAETAWNTDVTSASVTYSFKCYGKGSAPSGAVIFANTANTYSAVVTTPNVKYIFKHSFSGLPVTGGRVLGNYETGVTNGQDVTGDFIDVGFSVWLSGTTITPNTYGFTGTNQNREYNLYGYNGSLLIYSGTALTISTSSSGGTKYVSGSFSYPSGVTTVKITRGINGAAHSVSKTINSPTTSFTDDATDTSWSGNTTVSPNTAVPSTSRFDLVRTTLSQTTDNLMVVETTGSGNRFPSIAFGVAASTTSTHSVISRLVAESSTGYLHVGASRLVGYTSATFGQETWRLGSSYDFNLNRGSSNHFTFYSPTSGADLAYFFSAGDSNRGTVYFGQQTTSFGSSSKVVICPTAGGTIGLHFRRTSGFTGDCILIDELGSFKAGWGQSGRMYLNASAVSTTTFLLIGGTSSGSQIRLGAQSATGSTEGDLWNDSTNKTLTGYFNGVKQFINGNLFAQTATGTIANSVTETTISSTGQGTLVLPANFFVAGKTIRIRANGILSSVSSPTLRIRIKAGSTILLDTTAVTVGNHTNALWVVDGVITCRTTGGSGTVFSQGIFEEYGGTKNQHPMVNTATTTIATTSSQTMTLTAQWGTASASNTISCTNLTMEILV